MLENDVATLEDEVEEVETTNNLQQEAISILDGAVIENTNSIVGK